LYKHPELNITILRPCNIAGPGVRNTFSKLLASKTAPVLWGFSPLMQFIHIDDMREAICVAFEKNVPGLYNVAPADYIGFQDAVKKSNCKLIQIPSIPTSLTETISKVMKSDIFPPFLLNYYRYPVIIDGNLFEKTFQFKPKKSLEDIFNYYKGIK
jgi:UDP-glucose 4-epimerase